MKLRYCLSLFALLSLCASCHKGKEFYDYRQLNSGLWYNDSIQRFSFDSIPLNPISQYEIDIEITHNNTYPYLNLWLLIGHNLRDSIVRYDTVTVFLADRDGKWKGAGAAGLHQFSFPYKTHVHLDSVQNYRFSIKQIMNDNPLKGIEKIGLRITEEKNS